MVTRNGPRILLVLYLALCIMFVGCAWTGSTGVNAQLKPWFDFACQTYDEARPVIVALLDAAEAHPEVIPEKYRDGVKHFREETAPRLDRGLHVLCAAKDGQPVQHVIDNERARPDWGAIALQTARIATLALQLRANGKI